MKNLLISIKSFVGLICCSIESHKGYAVPDIENEFQGRSHWSMTKTRPLCKAPRNSVHKVTEIWSSLSHSLLWDWYLVMFVTQEHIKICTVTKDMCTLYLVLRVPICVA